MTLIRSLHKLLWLSGVGAVLAAPAGAVAAPTWSGQVALGAESSSAPRVSMNARGDVATASVFDDGGLGRIRVGVHPAGGSWARDTLAAATPILKADAPLVAIDGHGNATAAWLIADRLEVAYRPAGGVWGAPVTVSDPAEVPVGPDLAVDESSGNAVLAWRSLGTASQVVAAIRPAGGSWSAPVTLGGDPAHLADEPRAAISSGGAVVVWTLDDGGVKRVQAAWRPSGGAWSAAVYLSDAGQTALGPHVVVDSAGGAVAAWERWDGLDFRVQAAQRAPSGLWQTPVTLSPPGTGTQGVSLAAGPAGGTLAVWRSYVGLAPWNVQSAWRPPGRSARPAAASRSTRR